MHDFANNAGRLSKKHQASRGLSAIAELLVHLVITTLLVFCGIMPFGIFLIAAGEKVHLHLCYNCTVDAFQ